MAAKEETQAAKEAAHAAQLQLALLQRDMATSLNAHVMTVEEAQAVLARVRALLPPP